MQEIKKITPLKNQKVRNGKLEVIGKKPPSNSKIQIKVNEIINKLNEIIEVLNNERD